MLDNALFRRVRRVWKALCPAQWAWVALIAILGGSAMLASCGQRGPLIPPEPRETPRSEGNTLTPTTSLVALPAASNAALNRPMAPTRRASGLASERDDSMADSAVPMGTGRTA